MSKHLLGSLKNCKLLPAKCHPTHWTPELIMRILLNFCDIIGIDINSEIQEQTADAESQEIIPEELKLFTVYTALKHIFADIYLEDFLMSDITNPEEKKIHLLLKKLSNFLLFFAKIQEINTEKVEDIEERCKLKDLKLQELEQLDREILKKQKESGNLRSGVDEVERQIRDIEAEAKHVQEKDTAMGNIMEDKENELNAISKKYEELNAKDKKLNSEIENLKHEIVNSPDKYKSQLQELKRLEQEKVENNHNISSTIENKKTLLKDKQQYFRVVNECDETLHKCVELIQEHQKQKENETEYEKKFKELKIKVESTEEGTEKAKKEMKRAEDLEKAEEAKLEEKVLELGKTRGDYKDQIKELKREKNKNSKTIQEISKQEESVLLKTTTLKEDIQNTILEVRAKLIIDHQNMYDHNDKLKKFFK